MKPVQYFSDEYLDKTAHATTEQILLFLEEFRLMQAPGNTPAPRSKLISLKVAEDLLSLFRAKCDIEGVKYQTQIKTLMSLWIKKS